MQLGDARSGKLADNIVAFCRALRRAGVPIHSDRIALAQSSALLVGLNRKDDLAAALEIVLISQEQDRTVFAQMFDAFFRNPDLAHRLLGQMLPQGQERAKIKPSQRARVHEALKPVSSAKKGNAQKEQEIELDAAMSASQAIRLHHADFQTLNASEYALVEKLARNIQLALPKVQSRRTQTGARGHLVNWSRAIRHKSRHGGELLQLPFLKRREQPLPLLILIDISGSMERYARLMMAFLHQSTRHAPRSVFAFGTQLTDLTPSFRRVDTDSMLLNASERIGDFAGGTRLGQSLKELRIQYRRQLKGRRTLVLLISDGLDTGLVSELSQELIWLKRHCRKLMWLNPLLRFDGYAPLASGARILHQHADAMLAIHNLSRLEELAKAIKSLLKSD
ncbi:MAG: VWA domain-containing protein [Betaproteobacteria bacterium]|nr:VWA domain-containing protein [Betaproteobacteria bacterium]NBY05690.1 VWA domain-containing protein [Betaproteobacteria bacterium]